MGHVKINLSLLLIVTGYVCLAMPSLLLAQGDIAVTQQLKREFGPRPGTYELVTRISHPIVDPGGKLHGEVYLSGYGKIEAAKVALYSSPDVFVSNRSIVRIADGEAIKADPLAVVVSLNKASFFDTDGEYQISTECSIKDNAPINFEYAISKEARPGLQSIKVVLTYFDGETWKSSSKDIDFTIRNFYQRNEALVWWLGIPSLILTIIASLVQLWPVLLTMTCKLLGLLSR